MASFRTTHLITSFLFVLIPFAASITFNLTNIGPQNLNQDIVISGNSANISDAGIQLTDTSWNTGRATYARQLHLWNTSTRGLASFSTNFTFIIDSNGSTTYGDGLTFFLAQNNSVIIAGGAMGLPFNTTPNLANNPFVAVEFDTYWNTDWDPVVGRDTLIGEHVGIDVSSLSSATSRKWSTNVTGGGVCQAWITYDSFSKNLSVSFTGYENNIVVRQDGLVHTVDLRRELPEWVIFGFSAATGGQFQRTTVRSWSFDSSGMQNDVSNDLPPIQSPDVFILVPDSITGKNNKVRLIVGLSVSISSFLVVLIAFFVWRRIKKKRVVKEEEEEETAFDVEMNNEFDMGIGPRRFSYHELAQATNDFSETEKLGKGDSSGVYRGFLSDSNTYVAVKKVSKSSKHGINDYASEVRIISQLRHRNLVQLTGWCHEKGELLLVFEYMENGSLDSHLFNSKSVLTWSVRYKIANGLASAVFYLHEGREQCVLHRDIKSSNVLLDSNFNPKLGDFSLATLVDHENGSHTAKLAGTIGYMAPECVVTGKASKASDVFSFGVVALEIACGRKPMEYRAHEKQINLLEWVWELYGTGTLLEAVDPHLASDFDEHEIKCLMTVGLWCVHPDSKFRPSMRQVIHVLNSEGSLPILPSTMPVASYLAPHILSLFGVAYNTQNQSSSSISNTN